VAALIVVLSVMNGFYRVVRDLLVSVDPHVRIVSTRRAAWPWTIRWSSTCGGCPTWRK